MSQWYPSPNSGIDRLLLGTRYHSWKTHYEDYGLKRVVTLLSDIGEYSERFYADMFYYSYASMVLIMLHKREILFRKFS
jgi:hypothetical protein